MADLVFAFDPAIDRPIPIPMATAAASAGAPPAIAATLARAPLEALETAAAAARQAGAAAIVVCGRLLDPRRASLAQATAVRRLVLACAADGCRTIVITDSLKANHDLARMLGEPQGLSFVHPGAALELEVRGVPVEILSAFDPAAELGGDGAETPVVLRKRLVVGWDRGLWHGENEDPAAGSASDLPANAFSYPPALAAGEQPSGFWIWASRRCQMLPPGVHHLPPLQPRSAAEASAGACCRLTLVDRDPTGQGIAAPLATWRSTWREIPTQRVGWRTIKVDSPPGGDEELAAAIRTAMEKATTDDRPPDTTVLEIVRCAVACGTSVARRIRVGEIAAETLGQVRRTHDAKAAGRWCAEVFADPTEPLGALGHDRSGSRPGSTTSFSSALADIVTGIEDADNPLIPPALAREAGWLALELVEST